LGGAVVALAPGKSRGPAELGRGLTMGAAGSEPDPEERTFHLPVMVPETLDHLMVRPGGVYLDATLGEGGHTASILDATAPDGTVLGVEWDSRSLRRASLRLVGYGRRFVPLQGNYADMTSLARSVGVSQADGVLLDLGFSSGQVDGPGYGLSFRLDEPLDMRYDPSGPITAARIVNTYAQTELARIIYQYGEEHRSRAIAREIVRRRPIETTGELARVVAQAVGGRQRHRINPATRTFQALRIAVNDELANLEAGLAAAIELMAPGGRIVTISYHSLEDRLVKGVLARESARSTSWQGAPGSAVEGQPALRLVTRRVVRPTTEEVEINPRSRSARMRVAERL
jgi:16S rRNA (cytosine1402-N4)-methyltransferase